MAARPRVRQVVDRPGEADLGAVESYAALVKRLGSHKKAREAVAARRRAEAAFEGTREMRWEREEKAPVTPGVPAAAIPSSAVAVSLEGPAVGAEHAAPLAHAVQSGLVSSKESEKFAIAMHKGAPALLHRGKVRVGRERDDYAGRAVFPGTPGTAGQHLSRSTARELAERRGLFTEQPLVLRSDPSRLMQPFLGARLIDIVRDTPGSRASRKSGGRMGRRGSPSLPPSRGGNERVGIGSRGWVRTGDHGVLDDVVVTSIRHFWASGLLHLGRLGLTSLFPPQTQGRVTSIVEGEGKGEFGVDGADLFGNTLSGRMTETRSSARDRRSLAIVSRSSSRHSPVPKTQLQRWRRKGRRRRGGSGVVGEGIGEDGYEGEEVGDEDEEDEEEEGEEEGEEEEGGVFGGMRPPSSPLAPTPMFLPEEQQEGVSSFEARAGLESVAAHAFRVLAEHVLAGTPVVEIVAPHNRLSRGFSVYELVGGLKPRWNVPGVGKDGVGDEKSGVGAEEGAVGREATDDEVEKALTKALARADLSYNRFSSIPHPLCVAPSLTSLSLASNHLTRLQSLALPVLRELNVSDNAIQWVDSLALCPQLRNLDLSNNRLSKLPAHWRWLRSVESLSVAGNDLRSLALLGPDAPPRITDAAGSVGRREAKAPRVPPPKKLPVSAVATHLRATKPENRTLWSLVSDPITGEQGWMNTSTGELRREPPAELKDDGGAVPSRRGRRGRVESSHDQRESKVVGGISLESAASPAIKLAASKPKSTTIDASHKSLKRAVSFSPISPFHHHEGGWEGEGGGGGYGAEGGGDGFWGGDGHAAIGSVGYAADGYVWHVMWSEENQHPYYHNETTGESHWEPPDGFEPYYSYGEESGGDGGGGYGGDVGGGEAGVDETPTEKTHPDDVDGLTLPAEGILRADSWSASLEEPMGGVEWDGWDLILVDGEAAAGAVAVAGGEDGVYGEDPWEGMGPPTSEADPSQLHRSEKVAAALVSGRGYLHDGERVGDRKGSKQEIWTKGEAQATDPTTQLLALATGGTDSRPTSAATLPTQRGTTPSDLRPSAAAHIGEKEGDEHVGRSGGGVEALGMAMMESVADSSPIKSKHADALSAAVPKPIAPRRTVLYVNRQRGVVRAWIPPSADRWDRLRNLRHLDVRRNRLTSLPDSIFSLGLVTLRAEYNLISTLNAAVANCTTLRDLRVSHNLITYLPDELCAAAGPCQSLTRLDVAHCRLSELPAGLGTCTLLDTIDATHNAIQRLPHSMAKLEKLRVLRLEGNPLAFPPPEAVKRGISGVMWALRQAQHVYTRGPPPKVPILHSGGGGEVHSTAEEVMDLVLNKVRAAEAAERGEDWGEEGPPEDRGLALVPKGADPDHRLPPSEALAAPGGRSAVFLNRIVERWNELPPRFVAPLWASTRLAELRLEGNGMDRLPIGLSSLVSLRILSLRDNTLTSLTHSTMASLSNLTDLDVSGNRLVSLPPALCAMPGLCSLRLSDNRLVALPQALPQTLPSLTHLDLERNRLVELPTLLGTMRSLRVLLVGHNQLASIPRSIGALPNLHTLSAEANSLGKGRFGCGLPASITRCPRLQLLRLQHNGLKRLPRAFTAGPLAKEIRSLWLQGNDLPEIGDLLLRLPALVDIRLHQNPRLRSPPPRLLDHGLDVLRAYTMERIRRIRELNDRLREEASLIPEPARLVPVAGWATRGLGLPAGDGRGLLPHSVKEVYLDPLQGAEGYESGLAAARGSLPALPPSTTIPSSPITTPASSSSTSLIAPSIPKPASSTPWSVSDLSSLAPKIGEERRARHAKERSDVMDDWEMVQSKEEEDAEEIIAMEREGLDPAKYPRGEKVKRTFGGEGAPASTAIGSQAYRASLETSLALAKSRRGHRRRRLERVLQYQKHKTTSPTSPPSISKPRGPPLARHVAMLAYVSRDHVCSGGEGGKVLLTEDLASLDAALDRLVNGDFLRAPASIDSLLELAKALQERRRFSWMQAQVMAFQDIVDVLYQQSILSDSHILEMQRPFGPDGDSVPCYGIDLDAVYGSRLRPHGLTARQAARYYDPVRYPLPLLLKGGPRRVYQKAREGRVLWPVFGKEEDIEWEKRKKRKKKDGEMKERGDRGDRGAGVAGDVRRGSGEDGFKMVDNDVLDHLASPEDLDKLVRIARSGRYPRPCAVTPAVVTPAVPPVDSSCDWMWQTEPMLASDTSRLRKRLGNPLQPSEGSISQIAVEAGKEDEAPPSDISDGSASEIDAEEEEEILDRIRAQAWAKGKRALLRSLAGGLLRKLIVNDDDDGGGGSGGGKGGGGGGGGGDDGDGEGGGGEDDGEEGKADDDEDEAGKKKRKKEEMLKEKKKKLSKARAKRAKREAEAAAKREAALMGKRPSRRRWDKSHPYYRKPDIRERNGKRVDVNHPREAAKRRAARRHAVPLAFPTRFDLERNELEGVLENFVGPYGPVAEMEAAVPFPDCPCYALAERFSSSIDDLVAYRSRKRGGALVWGPLPQQNFTERLRHRHEGMTGGSRAADADEEAAEEAAEMKRQRAAAMREARMKSSVTVVHGHGSKAPPKVIKESDLLGMGEEARAEALAERCKALGLDPGEEDDIGVSVPWPRRDEKGHKIKIVAVSEDSIPVHAPSCIRPAIVIAQRTLTRQEAARRRAEERNSVALGERLVHSMRAWLLSPPGRRAVDAEAARRADIARREAMQADRRAKDRRDKVFALRGIAAARVKTLRGVQDRNKAMEKQGAFEKGAELRVQEAREAVEESAKKLAEARERLRRAENRARAYRAVANRSPAEWRMAVVRAVERRQRERAGELIFERERRRAFRKGWRRLWDGETGNGEDYQAWVERNMENRRVEMMRLLTMPSHPSDDEDPATSSAAAALAPASRVKRVAEKAKRGARSAFVVDVEGAKFFGDDATLAADAGADSDSSAEEERLAEHLETLLHGEDEDGGDGGVERARQAAEEEAREAREKKAFPLLTGGGATSEATKQRERESKADAKGTATTGTEAVLAEGGLDAHARSKRGLKLGGRERRSSAFGVSDSQLRGIDASLVGLGEDGGELGADIEEKLIRDGILSAAETGAAKRRYSFASASTISYEGKSDDEAEEQGKLEAMAAKREERELAKFEEEHGLRPESPIEKPPTPPPPKPTRLPKDRIDSEEEPDDDEGDGDGEGGAG